MEAMLEIRLRPRSYRDELMGVEDGVLHVRVRAAPVDGRANQALCRLVAKRLGVAPSRVSVARGERSREKLLRVEGIGRAELDAGLEGL